MLVKMALKDWAFVTTWHGVADLFKAQTWIAKMAWFILIVFSTFMFCSQCYSHWINYRSSERDPWVATSFAESKNRIELPNITLCNMNLVSWKSLKAMNMNLDAASYVILLYKSLFYPSLLEENKLYAEILENMSKEFDKYMDENEDLVNYTMYDMLVKLGPDCSVYMQLNAVEVPACQNATVFFTSSGLCYSFEPRYPDGTLAHQTSAGNELEVELYIFQTANDYAPIKVMQPLDYGMNLYLGFDAVGSTFGQRLAMIPGHHHWVSMAYEEYRAPQKPVVPTLNFALPESPCIEGVELEVIDSYTYTPQLCYIECMAKAYHDKCSSCVLLPIFPINDSTKYRHCSIQETRECWRNMTQKQHNHTDIYMTCDNKCNKSACNIKSISYSETGTKSPVNKTNYNRNLKLFRDVVFDFEGTHVNIFYDRMATKVTQYHLRTTVEQLISNVGGQMGLWAGISIITLCQALVFIVSGLFETANKWHKRKDLNNQSKVHMTQNNLVDDGKNEEVEAEAGVMKEELPDYMVEALQRYLAEKQKKKEKLPPI